MASLDSEVLQEEWETFSSIYPDFITSPLSKDGSLKLEVPVSLEVSHYITLEQEGACSSTSSPIVLSASALPPIILHVQFPSAYPSVHPPIIKVLKAAGSWLPSQKAARDWLVDQWVMGEPVLDRWATAIYSGDMLQALGLLDRVSQNIRLTHNNPKTLVPLLQEFDNMEKQRIFAESSFFCELCLNNVHGGQCLRLTCQHIFCRDCLKEFWGLHISEGDIERVSCPDQGCIKEKRRVFDEDIARVVSPDELDRLKWLRQKAILEKDPTVLYCPMSLCQSPVMMPREPVEEGSGWEKFRSCDSCGYNFCAYCRRTWHGPISHCRVSASESVVIDYLGHPNGSRQRKLLEDRYGVANITRLVKTYLEERANAELIENTTTKCPQCDTPIEKSLGCNHMTCARCHSHFCFRCGGRLNAKDPYAHFSQKTKPCYGKLFDQEALDWQPVDGFDLI